MFCLLTWCHTLHALSTILYHQCIHVPLPLLFFLKLYDLQCYLHSNFSHSSDRFLVMHLQKSKLCEWGKKAHHDWNMEQLEATAAHNVPLNQFEMRDILWLSQEYKPWHYQSIIWSVSIWSLPRIKWPAMIHVSRYFIIPQVFVQS